MAGKLMKDDELKSDGRKSTCSNRGAISALDWRD
jgi:hypothetical protein